jgi:mRNA interferase RelE/StbE
MNYQVFIRPRAQKSLSSLPKTDYDAVRDAMLKLGVNPRPHGCKKLVDRDGWRIRVGVYRIIYKIDDNQKTITAIDIGHRSDVY